MVLAVIVGLMSVEGWSNLQRQWNIAGEYQNVPTEQLMNWINENTLPRQFTISLSALLLVSFIENLLHRTHSVLSQL